eukprot:CAMPEP_0168397086 /NCGR_PEP_ID=MMETSP0228-20121227/20882_1 /TAXON_ID=133427 /ORGANISM="Protoceratium reticulatum, Strain CCCM 535 (=CCMP 1889)" /LENGTH=128 /DNA_ID=CAMNT_0008410547 /DNA_START=30 /DNA_END=416 /DNA_ORIENTATION=+
MARRLPAARLLVLGLAAACAWQLVGLSFVAPPRTPAQAGPETGLGAAVLAGAALAGPQAASAAELTGDGFGPAELTAIAIPLVLVVLAYLEWESKQEPTDSVTGVGTLGKQIDGAGKGAYFRRSPESG